MLDFNLANSDEPVVPEDPDQPDEPTPDEPEEPEAVNGYKLITSEPSDWSGSYLIVDHNKAYVFTGETGSSNMYALKTTDFTEGVITADLSSYAFTISKSGSSYYIKQGNNYYYCSYTSNSTTGIATSTSAQALKLQMIGGERFNCLKVGCVSVVSSLQVAI